MLSLHVCSIGHAQTGAAVTEPNLDAAAGGWSPQLQRATGDAERPPAKSSRKPGSKPPPRATPVAPPAVEPAAAMATAPPLRPTVSPPEATAAASGTSEPTISAASLTTAGANTTLTMTLSAAVPAEAYTMARPARVVVNLPRAHFRLPATAGREGNGLVSAFRYGLVAENQSRIVLDLVRPARIASARIAATANGGGTFTMVLEPVDAATFVRTAYEPPVLRRQTLVETAPQATPATDARPIVVIDPGHGGIDPGAVGLTDIFEKDIVLAVARNLRDALLRTGRYQVVMTRDSDVFVALDDRVDVSRAKQAALFISIHADAVARERADASSIRGATVYTLSERASDTVALRLAAKENAVDTLAGLTAIDTDERDVVRNILIDLMKAETSRFSSQFSSLLADRLKRSIAMSRQPRRSAAFHVLKQAQCPSVLIELGYMSNADDEKLMASVDWQKRVGVSIAAAVDSYFTKPRSARPHVAPR